MLLVLLLLLLTGGCSGEVDIAPPTPTRDTAGSRADAAQRTLEDLRSALTEHSTAGVEQVAAPGARELLGQVAANARALGITDVSLRYLDEAGPLDPAQQSLAGPDAWAGSVDLAYRYAGFDTEPAHVETDVVFVPQDGKVRISGFGGQDGRTPLWLTGPLRVVRTPRALLAVAAPDAGRYPRLVATAVRQVQAGLADWRGRLVVEVPESEEQLDAALDAEPGKYANIAAVTTTADGSLADGAPVRILVNPHVFDRLKPRGAQVVLTHEAVHAAEQAPFASIPSWLLEGFADWVALARAGVPVKVAGGQILARIRKEGLPDGLPTSTELDPSATGLGATYEEAWLACRYLASTYGDQKMIAFYRAVDDGSSTDEAFRSVLGVTEKAFVAGWRRDLARLAGVAG